MRRSDLLLAAVPFAALLAAVAGCGEDGGPDRVPAGGSVTVAGEPLAAGTVVFTPTGGGPRASAAVAGGRFVMDAAAGPVVGDHRVTVTPADPAAPAPDDEAAAARLARNPPAPVRLPPSAEFDATVEAGAANEFAFDLPAG